MGLEGAPTDVERTVAANINVYVVCAGRSTILNGDPLTK